MRVIDISAAAMIGLLSLGVLVASSPTGFWASAAESRERAALRGELVGIVQAKGLAWFEQASTVEVCAAVEGYSNATLTFSASVSGLGCGPLPPGGRAVVTLALPLSSRSVVLEAW